jgi:hypothetical protein
LVKCRAIRNFDAGIGGKRYFSNNSFAAVTDAACYLDVLPRPISGGNGTRIEISDCDKGLQANNITSSYVGLLTTRKKGGSYMEMLLILVVILALVVWMIKRKSSKASVASSPVEHGKPLAVAPKPASKRVVDTSATKQAEPPVVDAAETVEQVSKPAEVQVQPQPLRVVSPSPAAKMEEKVPEDSTLRRHYLNTRKAEKETITHPYPSDSALRRHCESISKFALSEALAAKTIESSAQLAKKPAIPEDSALRRHFLSQVQAEIESLFLRPTDSALKRHYDSLIKAKMEEYLTKGAV